MGWYREAKKESEFPPGTLEGTKVGEELLCDCEGCDPDLLKDHDHVGGFIDALVRAIGMKAVGEPTMALLPDDEPDIQGWSVTQLIQFSSIAMHSTIRTGYMTLDVFSCKRIPTDKVTATLKEWFRPRGITVRMLSR